MPLSANDLSDIPASEFRQLSNEELVGLVAHGQMSDNDTDSERGQNAWEELVLREFDRVTQLVKAFRFPDQPTVRVGADDVDDAVQAAFMRLLGMNFKGSSIGEFRAALGTCVKYACMDFCRAHMRIDQGLGGSLDDVVTDGDGNTKGRFDGELGRQEQERIDAQQAAQDQVRRIADSLGTLDNDQMRIALQMTWAGQSPDEIASELDVSVENVYQLRSRAQRKLLSDLYGSGHGKDSDGNG